MKLGLTNVYGKYHRVIDINSIEQLIKLMQEYNEALILRDNNFYNSKSNCVPSDYKKCEYVIEVYDNYRE